MGDLPQMTQEQLRMAKKLIRGKCCNYDQGNCIALDDGEPVSCPQGFSFSLICKWFRDAVLPIAPDLQFAIMKHGARKRCCVCGKFFYATSNRSKYCPLCSQKVRQQKEAARLRKHYLSSRI